MHELDWGKTTKYMMELLTVVVNVTINYVSIKTKQLKNIKIFIFIFVGVGP